MSAAIVAMARFLSIPRRNWAVLSLFAILSLAFNWRAVFQNRVIIGADWVYQVEPWRSEASDRFSPPVWNSETTDSVLQFLPVADYAQDALDARHGYFWDPYPFAGMPGLARGEAFSNPVFLLLGSFLPTLRALSWLVIVNLFLAAIFMFMLLSEMGTGSFAALLGALAFAYNGYLIGWLTNYHSASTMVWLPLIFWGFERAAKRMDWRWSVVSGAGFSLQIASGFVLWPVYAGATLGIYAIIRSLMAWLKTRQWRTAAMPLLAAGLILCIGAALASPQLLLTLQLYSQSQRSQSYGAQIFYSLPRILVRLFSPTAYGSPLQGESYWGGANYTETGLYFGLLPVVFLLAIPWISKRKIGWVFAFLGAACLLAVHGTFPFRQITALAYPVFLKTSPMRIFHIVAFAWSIAAAFAADWALQSGQPMRLRRLAAASAILACGFGAMIALHILPVENTPAWFGPWLHGIRTVQLAALLRPALILAALAGLLWLWSRKQSTWLYQGLALGILVADLFSAGMQFNPMVEPAAVLPQTPSLRILARRVSKSVVPDRAVNIGSNQILLDMTAQYYDVPTVTGYSSWVLKRYLEYVGLIDTLTPTLSTYVYFNDCCHPLLDALNVRFVYAPASVGMRSLESGSVSDVNTAPALALVYDGPNRIYKNLNAFPRAWVVHAAYLASEGNIEQVKEYLRSVQLRLDEVAVVEMPQGGSGYHAYTSQPLQAPDQVTILEYSAEKVRMEVAISQPGLLVLADVMYPGWQATVDGERQPIRNTNIIMRGVELAAGEHYVEFRYVPVLFYVGLAVMFAMIILITAAFVYTRRRST